MPVREEYNRVELNLPAQSRGRQPVPGQAGVFIDGTPLYNVEQVTVATNPSDGLTRVQVTFIAEVAGATPHNVGDIIKGHSK